MINLENISKVYPTGEHEVHALREINLDIAEGEMTAIVGPSGSGKSTLLNIGFLGISGGVASSLLASHFAGWPTAFSLQIIALAFIFSSGVGLAAGIYPALKASKLTPMEALRAE